MLFCDGSHVVIYSVALVACGIGINVADVDDGVDDVSNGLDTNDAVVVVVVVVVAFFVVVRLFVDSADGVVVFVLDCTVVFCFFVNTGLVFLGCVFVDKLKACFVVRKIDFCVGGVVGS